MKSIRLLCKKALRASQTQDVILQASLQIHILVLAGPPVGVFFTQ